MANLAKNIISKRFRGLLPIVIDVETSGLDPAVHSMLEIAAVTIVMDSNGILRPGETLAYQVEPFVGSQVDAKSLEVTKIDPTYPLRFAIPEQQALHQIFTRVRQLLAEMQCQRAVLVGHNAWFDLAFLQAAIKRCQFTRHPFHSFTSLDTASLAALMLGETVLAKSARKAGIRFDVNQAHSAIYDAEKTAELFCYMVNRLGKI